MKAIENKTTKPKLVSVSKQEELIMLPHLGNTMATFLQNNEDGTHIAGDYYYVEAVDGKEMTIRLRHPETSEIKEGKFIRFPQPDNSWAIIFRDDIEADSFPVAYTEIEY